MIKCKDIIQYLEELAPLNLAESWDNPGLMVGNEEQVVENVLVTLDVTPQVVKEAISKGIDLIISHHPMIFKAIKKINENDLLGSMIYGLIQNKISVYAAHTNLDIVKGGLNDLLASLLKLEEVEVLEELRRKKMKKIVVFVPVGYEDRVREAMAGAGAGWIGDYSDCTFMVQGIGTFKPLEGTNPFIGSKGQLEKVNEYRLETIVPEEKVNGVIKSMLQAHPYEEVAYDIYHLEVEGQPIGLGRIGKLREKVRFGDFVDNVKKVLNTDYIRYVGNEESYVSRVALCTGSGAEFIQISATKNADVYITGDIKYHDAQLAQQLGLNIIDAGHYETENIVVPFLVDYLKDAFASKGINIVPAEFNKPIYKIK
ncbi:MAG: Nif3-like dinuclear metal center hexameric protein [Clostridiaceae bacterium]|nr:Nif3-like dinuclear metal center hexameric protein [Clostridiaceae bacterium]